LPSSIKRYSKLLAKYSTPSDIEVQKLIDEYALKFDAEFCNNNLLKFGTIQLALKKDRKYLNACPKNNNGITYIYPTEPRWGYMKRGFACYIDHKLSRPK
jgi:hypothetical protein